MVPRPTTTFKRQNHTVGWDWQAVTWCCMYMYVLKHMQWLDGWVLYLMDVLALPEVGTDSMLVNRPTLPGWNPGGCTSKRSCCDSFDLILFGLVGHEMQRSTKELLVVYSSYSTCISKSIRITSAHFTLQSLNPWILDIMCYLIKGWWNISESLHNLRIHISTAATRGPRKIAALGALLEGCLSWCNGLSFSKLYSDS